jgi:hypothetical protein
MFDKKELKKVVLDMDRESQVFLACSLVEGIFDEDFEYTIDYVENLVNIVESITGVDNLVNELPPML